MPHAARVSARHAVYETLRHRIVSLELPPGTSLFENELAAELKVSRTPVRECLLLLGEEGFVDVFPRVGTFVSRVDPGRVADAQFVREAIELASLASLDVLDEDHVSALKENVSLQRQSLPDLDEFLVLDDAFHQGLLGLAGHVDTWATLSSAKAHLERARRLGLDRTPPEVYVDQHAEILDAISEDRRAEATELLRAHLRAVFDDVDEIRLRSPELFSGGGRSVPVRSSVVRWT